MSALISDCANTGRALTFTIPGRIGGKGRHRSVIRGGRIATYTPQKTESDEALVRHFAADAMRQRRMPQLIGPLRMRVAVFRHHPKSWTVRQIIAAKGWITGKPDLDNIAKLICDACNGIAYADDSQIASLSIARLFVKSGDAERVDVSFFELEAA